MIMQTGTRGTPQGAGGGTGGRDSGQQNGEQPPAHAAGVAVSRSASAGARGFSGWPRR